MHKSIRERRLAKEPKRVGKEGTDAQLFAEETLVQIEHAPGTSSTLLCVLMFFCIACVPSHFRAFSILASDHSYAAPIV
jgi:hypothetical protein